MSEDPGQAAGRNWLPKGTRLNDMYELEEGIAAGGMGEIYRGRNIETHDPVAIKMIRSDLAETEATMTMFRKEASALNKLYNEAIVRYYGFSVDPTLKRPYMAMEFVSGRAISDIVRTDPFPYRELCMLGARVASGLQVAHERGIIHRDISPDNIIIPEGDVTQAKIIDFGIARQTKSSEGTIIGDGLAGKYNYMSPEQLGLNDGDVRAASDIYSLGLVLAEAATGRSINMRGNPVELIEKRRKVPDLSHIDPRLQPLIAWMLQPLPHDRPASMTDVANWLRAAQDARPSGAPGPSADATVVMPGVRPGSARPDESRGGGRSSVQPGTPGWTGDPSTTPSAWPGARSVPPPGWGNETPQRPTSPPQGWGPEVSQRPSTPPQGWPPEVSQRPSAPPPGWGQEPSQRPTTPPQSWPQEVSQRPSTPPPGWGQEPSQRPTTPPAGWDHDVSRRPPTVPPAPPPRVMSSVHPGSEAELGTVVARPAPPRAPVEPPPPPRPVAAASPSPTPAQMARAAAPVAAEPKKSSMPLVAAIGAVVLLGGGGVGAWLAMSGPSKPPQVAEKPVEPVKPVEPAKTQPVQATQPTQPTAQADATVKPSAEDLAAAPRRPGLRAEDLARYLAQYGGGECFYLDPVLITDNRVVTEGFGRSIVPFEALDEDFRARHGFEADIRLRQVSEAQCPAIDFLARTRGEGKTAVRLEIAGSRVHGGDHFAGLAGGTPGSFVSVVTIGEDGTAKVVAPSTAGDKPVSFVMAAEQVEKSGRPRLVMAFASDRALPSLGDGPAQPVSAFLERLAKDATQSGTKLASVARYVVIER